MSAAVSQQEFHWESVDQSNPVPFRLVAVEQAARWCMRARGFSPTAERAVLEALQQLALWDEP